MKWTWILFAGTLLALAPVSAKAQVVPGAPEVDWERQQQEYTADVLRAYSDLMAAWREAWESGNAKATSDFYTDGAFLFADAELLQGKGAIQARLEKMMTRIVTMKTGLSDFVASDRLAYALGPLWYRVKTADGKYQDVSGTALTVLVREGKRWKIRSQIFHAGGNDSVSME